MSVFNIFSISEEINKIVRC